MSIPRIQGMRMGPTVEMAQLLQQQPQRSQMVKDEVMKATRGQIAQALRGDPRMGTADRLAASAMDTSPIQSPFQGLARLLQGHAANKLRTEAQGEAEATANNQAAALAKFLQDKPELQALAQAGMPDAAVQAAVQTPEQAERFEPITDAEGNVIAQKSTLTGRIVDSPLAPETEKPRSPTAVEQQLVAAGYEPGTPEFQEAMRKKLFDAQPLVQIGDGSSAGTSEQVLSRYQNAYDSSRQAAENLRGLEQMLTLAPQVQSGWTAEAQLEARKALAALGMDVDMDEIATAEQFRTLSMDRIMERIAGTKGAISEKEMDAFERASPSLRNTPQGNQLILKAAVEAERRKQQVNDFVINTIQENPEIGLFALDKKRRDFEREIAEKPMFTAEERAMLGLEGDGAGSGGDDDELNVLIEQYGGVQ